jgi:hypothetical protein
MAETQTQRVERILQHLIEVHAHAEHDVTATTDEMLKRIEVDAATIVALSLIAELLPEPIQDQIQCIINLHEKVWNADTPPSPRVTPRKPLGERLIRRLASSFTWASEEKSTTRPKTPSLTPPPPS